MSVLIKGMEMPTSCADCRLMADGWCYSVGLEQREKISTVKRPTWCPLVEIPQHGRLIDGDLLPWFLANTDVKFESYEDWEKLCDYISAAPTIIPAEEADHA